MLLVDQCQVMLPNNCQCPNGVLTAKTAPSTLQSWNPERCLLHNQLDTAQNAAQYIVDETNENTNSIPADKV